MRAISTYLAELNLTLFLPLWLLGQKAQMVRQSREKERGGGQPLLAVNTHQPVLGSHDGESDSNGDGVSDSERSHYLRQLKPTNSNRMKLIAVGLFYLSNNNNLYNNNDISHVIKYLTFLNSSTTL